MNGFILVVMGLVSQADLPNHTAFASERECVQAGQAWENRMKATYSRERPLWSCYPIKMTQI